MIASARNIGDAPISVIHQGVEDIERKDNKRYREDADGVISCSSRLKLAELIVWIKRLTSIKKLSNFTAVAFSALGIVATVLVITLGVAQHINQLYILLYMMIELCVIASVMMLKIPHSRYFTADSLYTDIEKEHRKMIEKEQKQGKKNK